MLNLCHISSLKRRKVCAFVLIVCLISGLTPTAESISVKLRGKIALGGILSGLACVTYALVTRDKRAAEKLQLHLGPPDRVIQFERGFNRWRVNYYGKQCYLFRNNLFIETVPCTNPLTKFVKNVRISLRKGKSRKALDGRYCRNTLSVGKDASWRIPCFLFVRDAHQNDKARFVRGWDSNPWRRGNQTFARKHPLLIPQVLPCKIAEAPECIRGSITDTPVSGSPKWLRLYLSRPQRVPQFVSSCLYRLEDERLLGLQLLLSR